MLIVHPVEIELENDVYQGSTGRDETDEGTT